MHISSHVFFYLFMITAFPTSRPIKHIWWGGGIHFHKILDSLRWFKLDVTFVARRPLTCDTVHPADTVQR